MVEMLIRCLFLFFLAIALPGYAQTPPPASGEVVKHTYYTLDYNEQHEQPNWVFYRLTIDNVKGTVKRKDDFRPDPDVRRSCQTTKAAGMIVDTCVRLPI